MTFLGQHRIVMPHPHRAEALNDDARLSDVCLSHTLGLSREQRPRKTKIGTEVAHVTCDSDTTFKVKRSKVNLQVAGAYCGGLPHSLFVIVAIHDDDEDADRRSAHVRRQEFVSGLSVLSRGNLHEKLLWTFSLYDTNHDGIVTKDEMLDIVSAIYDLMNPATTTVYSHQGRDARHSQCHLRLDGQVRRADHS